MLDRTRLRDDLAALGPVLRDVARRIHDKPELRFEEHEACALITSTVEERGVSVEKNLGMMPTAFRARVGTGGAPRVAILAEYDALPEIGHACGHNLIAAGALGAFLAVAPQAAALGGTVELVGTPAEEGGGGKIRLIEHGIFEGVDVAMMFHPFDRDLLAHPTLANLWIDFEWRGKASHAALAPWEGASALTACLETFRLIDSQRVHFRDGVRVHGYVTHGGDAVNIIPELARAQFSVRAFEQKELDRVRAIVERCARGAALATGTEVTMNAHTGYRDLRNNAALAARFGEHLTRLGRAPQMTDPDVGTGSTDMGDVSHVVPSIHPWVAICDRGEATCHQHAFAAIAGSARGEDAMLIAAETMALTAVDVIEDAALRSAARAEFEARR